MTIRRAFNQTKPDVLAIIPARSGSKGIPQKNIRNMGGKPLMAWSIEAALASHHVTRVIVSTDDPTFAQVAISYGAEVPFLRPGNLSEDCSILGDAFAHVINELMVREGYIPDVAVHLFPTHPFRPPGLIDHLVDKILEGYQRAMTVVSYNSRSISLSNRETGAMNASECTEGFCFVQQGLVTALRINNACRKRTYLFPLTDKVTLVDIDTPSDLELATRIVEQGLYPMGAK